MPTNMIAKLGYSFIVVISPTADISADRKNTEYIIAAFIFMFWFLYTCSPYLIFLPINIIAPIISNTFIIISSSANGIHSGLVTHHQLQSISPVSLSTRNTINSIVNIPELNIVTCFSLLILFCFYTNVHPSIVTIPNSQCYLILIIVFY